MEPKSPVEFHNFISLSLGLIAHLYAGRPKKRVDFGALPASLTELAVPQRSELFLNQEKNAVLFLT